MPHAKPPLSTWRNLLITLAVLLLGTGSALAQQKFVCNGEALQTIQPTSSNIVEIDQTVTPFTFTTVGNVPFQLNNIGVRRTDGLLYGWDQSNSRLISVSRDSIVTDLGVPTGIPGSSNFNSGDVSVDSSIIFLSRGTSASAYTVDLTALPGPLTATPRTIGGETDGSIVDWAFNPLNGKLYAGNDFSNDGELISELDLATNTRVDYVLTGLSAAGQGFGAAWFDTVGNFFIYRNDGEIFQIDLDLQGTPPNTTAGSPSVVSQQSGAASTNNDGAACINDVLAVAKDMTAVDNTLPSTVTIDYYFENFSPGTLSNLTSTDDLAAVFGVPGVDWTFTSITSSIGGFANAGFDGDPGGDIELIGAGQTLAAASTVQITVTIEVLTVDGQDGDGNFCNQVNFEATDSFGGLFGDLSTDGTDPTPVGNPAARELSCLAAVDLPVELMEFTID